METITLRREQEEMVELFLEQADFSRGFLALDLDGTALHETEGRIFISASVERGVKKIDEIGRPVVLNTLRFPLSVMKTVGEEWYRIADSPIPTVLLNGSVLGYIHHNGKGLEYKEIVCFPLTPAEVSELVRGIRELLENDVCDILLFFYTRDWQIGETIWTPDPTRVGPLWQKYAASVSRVFSGDADALAQELGRHEICMASLIIDRSADMLMAYQHSKPSSFFTSEGVDKAFGMRELARRFGWSLADSFGAGDTIMDSFLCELGLSLLVGQHPPSYQGQFGTLRVKDSLELGDIISVIADRVTRPL